MTDTRTEPTGLPRLADDNVPHLALFDRASGTNFKWDGNIEHPIEVEGGYSDAPVTHHIEVPHHLIMLGLNGASLPNMLHTFANVCRAWIERDLEGTGPFTGFICKRCGAESPTGIGYAATAAEVDTPAADCPNPHTQGA